MKGYRGSTIYKSGSCDLCVARAYGESLELEQGQVGARSGAIPELGRDWVKPELG
jgi:hypothetical protein